MTPLLVIAWQAISFVLIFGYGPFVLLFCLSLDVVINYARPPNYLHTNEVLC